MQKNILVCGAGGFIGGHLVNALVAQGHKVTGVDLKANEYGNTQAHKFIIGDLRLPQIAQQAVQGMDEVYQLAADMGGAGYIFTGHNDANVMHNSVLCNTNVLDAATKAGVKKIFYSSSACMYPEYNQLDPNNPKCAEDSAYPAAPDSEYGWEKLFSERLYLAYQKNYGIQVRIARFHNIFGPQGTWQGGKEKAPAALCRKVAEAANNGTIEVWGNGLQTRSFLYITECIQGILKLMDSDFTGPVNLGSEEMISINDFAKMAIQISGKTLSLKNIEGPTGVAGRNSDNTLIQQKLNWKPSQPLIVGMQETYNWVQQQVALANTK
jgi:GDP-D-mannose 3', 5'-epimerase